MADWKIGVILSSFHLEDVTKMLETAVEVGVDGVQLWNVGGPLDPENLIGEARRKFLRQVRDQGLEISALCGDLGGGGFANPDRMDWRIERTKEMIDLSIDLEAPIVTTHIGIVPPDPQSPERKSMLESLQVVGDYAAERGAVLATETGPEPGQVLRKFLDELDNPGIKVNFDPANFVMWGFDYLSAVGDLGPYIVHTHAKDAVRHPDGRPEEVVVGQGAIDWPAYLTALEAVGYSGWLVIEREAGEDRVGDVRRAVEFLRQF